MSATDIKSQSYLRPSFICHTCLLSSLYPPKTPPTLIATKERNTPHNPLTKEMQNENLRHPMLLVQIPGPCSAFISLASMPSFDCLTIISYLHSPINGKTFSNFLSSHEQWDNHWSTPGSASYWFRTKIAVGEKVKAQFRFSRARLS